MSSNTGNPKTGQGATEGTAEDRSKVDSNQEDILNDEEIRVNDRRRFSSDGEPLRNFGMDDPISAAESLLEIEQLQAKLRESEDKRAEAERQVYDLNERFRTAQSQLKAETDEQRARMQRTFDQKLEVARGDIIANLLDTLDNLKRALAAAEKSDKSEADFNSLLEGLRATAGMFEAKMQNLGLSRVPSVGEEFNPEIHEAVELVTVPPEQDHLVIEEYQTGYKFGDRLLRPARVRVGKS